MDTSQSHRALPNRVVSRIQCAEIEIPIAQHGLPNTYRLIGGSQIMMKVPRRRIRFSSIVLTRGFASTTSRREIRDLTQLPDRNAPNYFGTLVTSSNGVTLAKNLRDPTSRLIISSMVLSAPKHPPSQEGRSSRGYRRPSRIRPVRIQLLA